MINFNSIPINLRVPGNYVEIDNSKANQGLTGMPTKVLVIGQKLATGIQAALAPVLITSVDQARQYFGKGSMLALMLEKFKGANDFVECWAIAQDDAAGGVLAAGSVTFTGTATAAGTLNFYLGGVLIQTAVAAGDTAAAIATAFAAALTANTNLPVTAAVDGVTTSKVNITARNKGECANSIDLRFNYYSDQFLPTGVTAAIVAMAGGTGNPLVTAVTAAIGDEWYTDFVMPYTDTANIAAMETKLTDRFGPLQMRDGYMYMNVSDTHANLVTKGSGRNCPLASILGSKKSPTPPYEVAAILAAVCAYNLQIDPARPVQTLVLTGMMAPAIADRFTQAEQNILLYNGISTFNVGADGTVSLQRVVTTYRLNSFGAADESYLDIETMKTLAYLRYDSRVFIGQRYPRHKLADDGTNFARGQNVVTPSVIRAALISRFALWEEAGLAEDIEQFKADLLVERNKNDPNRLDALTSPNLVNQFRVFGKKLEFRR